VDGIKDAAKESSQRRIVDEKDSFKKYFLLFEEI
jgi:hypothetical protein